MQISIKILIELREVENSIYKYYDDIETLYQAINQEIDMLCSIQKAIDD